MFTKQETIFNRLSLWQSHKQKNCTKCLSFCCRLPVEVTLDDLKRMGLVHLAEEDARPTLKRIARDLIAKKIIQSFRVGTNLFLLAQKPNGDCVYLDSTKRSCTIYEKRPGVCRRFPEIGPRPSFCPYIPAPD